MLKQRDLFHSGQAHQSKQLETSRNFNTRKGHRKFQLVLAIEGGELDR